MADCDSTDDSDQKSSTSGNIVQDKLKLDSEDIITKEFPVVVKICFSTVQADTVVIILISDLVYDIHLFVLLLIGRYATICCNCDC